MTSISGKSLGARRHSLFAPIIVDVAIDGVDSSNSNRPVVRPHVRRCHSLPSLSDCWHAMARMPTQRTSYTFPQRRSSVRQQLLGPRAIACQPDALVATLPHPREPFLAYPKVSHYGSKVPAEYLLSAEGRTRVFAPSPPLIEQVSDPDAEQWLHLAAVPDECSHRRR